MAPEHRTTAKACKTGEELLAFLTSYAASNPGVVATMLVQAMGPSIYAGRSKKRR